MTLILLLIGVCSILYTVNYTFTGDATKSAFITFGAVLLAAFAGILIFN